MNATDEILLPEFVTFVLQPLKVADDHAARVAEDVRQQSSSLFLQDDIAPVAS